MIVLLKVELKATTVILTGEVYISAEVSGKGTINIGLEYLNLRVGR